MDPRPPCKEGLHRTSYTAALIHSTNPILACCNKPCVFSRHILAADLLPENKDNCAASRFLTTPLLSQSAREPEQQRKAQGKEYRGAHWKKALIINIDSRVILYFMSFFSLSPQAPRRWQMFSGITWRAMCLFFCLFLIVKIPPHLKGLREETYFFCQMPNSDLHQMQSTFLKNLQSSCLIENLPFQRYELVH